MLECISDLLLNFYGRFINHLNCQYQFDVIIARYKCFIF